MVRDKNNPPSSSKVNEATAAGKPIMDEQWVLNQLELTSWSGASSGTSSAGSGASTSGSKAASSSSSSSSTSSTSGSKPFAGFVFCITGTMKTYKKTEFETALLQSGATKVKKAMTRDVTHLICLDSSNPGAGTKVIAAQQLETCTIVSEDWIVARMSYVAGTCESTKDSSESSNGVAEDASIFPIPACMLANKYEIGRNMDPTYKTAKKVQGWYMSEKLGRYSSDNKSGMRMKHCSFDFYYFFSFLQICFIGIASYLLYSKTL